MTLDSKLSKAVYQGNGSTTVFPFAFKVWDTSQIAVTMTDAAGVSTDVTSNSTVTLTSSGGSVAYPATGSPLPTGAKLAITRNMSFTQGISLVSASRFDPQVLEDGLDQSTAERQQILEQMGRAVILPATSSESPEDVVTAIYASRDAAAASADAATVSANAASAQATAAKNSADTAAQTVQTASAGAVADATAQANAAAASATAAAQSAAEAEAASGGLSGRMDAVESKNTQQDTRLNDVEAVTALVTTTPGAGKVPKADSNNKLAPGWFDMASVKSLFSNLKGSAAGTSASFTISADELVLRSSANLYITLRNLSLTGSTASTGAGGLDTGSIAASTLYYVFVIYNTTTATAALLFSLSNTSPTLPSGYTYFARVGHIRTDSTNKYPLRFVQSGETWVYAPLAGTNVTEYPGMVAGAQGTWTSATYTPVAVLLNTFIPPTAKKITFLMYNGGAGNAMAAGVNATGGGWDSSTCPQFHNLVSGSAVLAMVCTAALETNYLHVAAVGASVIYRCIGCEDNL